MKSKRTRNRKRKRKLRTVTVVHLDSSAQRRMPDSELEKRIIAMNPLQREVLLRRLSKLSATTLSATAAALSATAAASSGVKRVEAEAMNGTMRRVLVRLARNPYARAGVGRAMSEAWVDMGRAMRECLIEERRVRTHERP